MASSSRRDQEPQQALFTPFASSSTTGRKQRTKKWGRGHLLFFFGGVVVYFCILLVEHVFVLRITSKDSVSDGREFGNHHSSSLAPPRPNQSSSRAKNAMSPTTRSTAKTNTLPADEESNHKKDISDVKKSTDHMRTLTGYFNPQIHEFERQEGVVIVTKIHDKAYIPMLEQMLCLLHHAYNHRVHYDIVVFTTEFIDPSLAVNLTHTVAPAKLTVVKDNRGLQEEIANLTPERRRQFIKDCNLKDESSSAEEILANLTWWSECPRRLAYNWQAEFRSWHIWNHPALAPYHWMMWLDADAFCAKKWERDPVAIALQHNTTILYDNFPQGSAGGREIQQRIQTAFGNSTALCNVKLSPLGHFVRQVNEECIGQVENDKNNIPLIHGFFHITNMDFYRNHLYWAEALIGNGFLQRRFDDQIAVTVPAAFLTPHQSWLLRGVGIELGVHHNGKLDGFSKTPGGGFKRWWLKKGGKEGFPEAAAACPAVAGG